MSPFLTLKLGFLMVKNLLSFEAEAEEVQAEEERLFVSMDEEASFACLDFFGTSDFLAFFQDGSFFALSYLVFLFSLYSLRLTRETKWLG